MILRLLKIGSICSPGSVAVGGFLLQVYKELHDLHVCVLERACWRRCRVLLDGSAVRAVWVCVCVCALHFVCAHFGAGMPMPLAAAGCRVLLLEWCALWGDMLVLQGVAPRCLKVLLSKQCLRFGAGMMVAPAGCRCRMLLQGAAVKAACALWSGHAGEAAGCCRVPVQGAVVRVAAVGCRCNLLLQGAAVRLVRALWSWLAGAAELGCCYSALLSECGVRYEGWCCMASLQGGGGRKRKEEEGRGRRRKEEGGGRRRKEEEGGRRRKEEGGGRRREEKGRLANIKPNNPHLTDGEKGQNKHETNRTRRNNSYRSCNKRISM